MPPVKLFQRQTLGTQVQRHALAGTRAGRGLILRMQATHAYRFSLGAEHQRITHRHLPG
ncbi:hypothetical protein D3C87_1424270 [compost metagenome]